MRSLLCIKRDVEDTGFPEPKYEVWGFSDTVPYKRTSAHRYARTSARPLFTLAPARKYQYVEKIAKIILNISICRKSIMKSNGKGERI